MTHFFSEEVRRNPFPVYERIRSSSPLFREPQAGLWMLFDYESVKRILSDHDAFSSRLGPDWLVFADPPRHTKLRALISQAFTPRSVANLEARIRELSRELLDQTIERGEMDLAGDFSVPLPIRVIAELLGIELTERQGFDCCTHVILKMSYTIGGGEQVSRAVTEEFTAVTAEMNTYLTDVLRQRRAAPKDDLLTRLVQAEVDGERLTQEEILGFFQLLLLAGSETTTNLINNAILCLIENPKELARLIANPGLLPLAIEEVLRYRSPLQWIYRLPRRDVEIHGQVLHAGELVLAMIGSANRDPKQFRDADRFDISRNPNPHIAFSHGVHFCLGAPLSRLEARIALEHLLQRVKGIALATDEPWEPRKGLHVHGPTRLQIRFEPGKRAT